MATIADLFTLLEDQPHDFTADHALPKDTEDALRTILDMLLACNDDITKDDVQLPEGLLAWVGSNAHDPEALKSKIMELWGGDATEGVSVDPEPLPDDGGRCIQGSSFWTGLLCMPTPNCLITDLGCIPGHIKVGWCFAVSENGGEGCRCQRMDIPLATILILLALATFFFSPALTVPLRILIMRMAQRGVVIGIG